MSFAVSLVVAFLSGFVLANDLGRVIVRGVAGNLTLLLLYGLLPFGLSATEIVVNRIAAYTLGG